MFKNLNIDQKTKTVLQGLIEVHAEGRPFDDFVEGKGLGIVVNLFGKFPSKACKTFFSLTWNRATRCREVLYSRGDE